jgi:hypothetical protein
MSISSNISLLHPALQRKDKEYLEWRSMFPLRYMFPFDEQISWYGGAIRPDGGQGMYMSGAQSAEWKEWVRSDIGIGPS